MVPPSLHHRLVASLPLGTYKRCPGRASPRCTPHRPLFLLSRVGARPHRAPSIATALPPSPGRFSVAPSPVRAPPTPPRPQHPRHHHVPLSLLRPSRRPLASRSAYAPHSGGRGVVLLAAPPWSTMDRAPGVVYMPWTESTDYSIQK
jgi:hypothetical protein